MKHAVAILAGLALLTGGMEARASSLVQVDYTFEIDDAFGGFPAPIAVSGTAFYDLAGLDLSPLPHQGVFSLSGHSVLFGGVPRAPGTDAWGVFASEIRFEDQVPFTPPRDRIVLFSTFNFVTGDIRVDGIGFTLEGPASVFTGDEPFIPLVSDFTIDTSGFVAFTNQLTGGLFAVSAPLDVTFSAVPAPPAVVQLALGLGTLVAMARRRDRSQRRSRTAAGAHPRTGR